MASSSRIVCWAVGLLVAPVLAAAAIPPATVRFTRPSARYLYAPPRGPHRDISSAAGVALLVASVNTHGGGYDYPIQLTRGEFGVTPFDDLHWYYNRDRVQVPNIAPGGGFRPSTGSDGHLIVVDTRHHRAYDFWRLCVNALGAPATCRGNASPTSVGYITSYDLRSSNGTPGGTASGLSGLAGDLLASELGSGHIGHALSVVVPAAMMSPIVGHAAPANHSDGKVPGGIFREGAKIRLDPAVNVADLAASRDAKTILLALQRYGGIVTDQSDCPHCLGIYSNVDGPAPDLSGLDPVLRAHLWIYYGQ